MGRQQGQKNRITPAGASVNKYHNRNFGKAFVHTVIDDNSHVAYTEIHGDEKADSAVGVLKRAVSWFAARCVAVERALSDIGSAYK